MKKIICMVLLVVMMATLLVSCGKFTCDSCLQEKSGKKHTTEIFGVEMTICDDCYKATKEVSDALSDLLG